MDTADYRTIRLTLLNRNDEIASSITTTLQLEVCPIFPFSCNDLTALDKIGYSADFVEQLPLPFPVAGAVWIEHQAQIDPQS